MQGAAGISLSGLALGAGAWGATARSALEWVCGLGYAWVQIDAAMPGLRPRELDRSARREVLSMLTRRGAGVSGLDLFVPAAHFVDAAHVDRAAGAVREALTLAGEWGVAMSVTVALPEKVPAPVVAELVSHAERVGAVLADASWPANAGSDVRLGVALDPAAVFAAGGEVMKAASTAPASARLSDMGSVGRVEAGRGRLDVLAYRVALSVAGYARPLVVDLRGLRDQAGAAVRSRGLVEGTLS
ncbi:MAG TPA: hypothetical protein VHN77_07475 [Phycisphaerales bacterium]|nr:hypothetical protein [Phycisphaerales bacterium]